MPTFMTTRDTFLYKDPDATSAHLADVPKDTTFSGELQGNFIKTQMSALSPTMGFVQFLGVSTKVMSPEPLTPADFGNFCDMVTRAAREAGADRDYLMAVAYRGTKNLTKFGGKTSSKAGPFQFTKVEWQVAIDGPAKNGGFLPADRLDWTRQPKVAALLAAEYSRQFRADLGRDPTFSELHFVQLFGAGAIDVLKKPPATLSKDAVQGTPARGTYAAKLKAGKGSIANALTKLRTGLIAGLAEALKLIDQQPPEIQFIRPENRDPPWLAVARAEMNLGVSETAEKKNSDRIKEYLAKTDTPDPNGNTPWCGAFATYCMKMSGVPGIENSVKTPDSAATDWWKNWGQAATDPMGVGTVLILKPAGSDGHVGFLVEGSDSNTIKLLAGNQGGGGNGPDRVGIVQFNAGDVQMRRWLPIEPPKSAIQASKDDKLFVQKAPVVMKQLMKDFPGLELIHAGAVLGNIGHECAGFHAFHQIGMPEGQGGYGWCQWDGDRRQQFFKMCSDKGLDRQADDANYAFLTFELKGSQRSAFAATRQETTLESAVHVFDRLFEVSGVPNLPSRIRYARLALQAYNAS